MAIFPWGEAAGHNRVTIYDHKKETAMAEKPNLSNELEKMNAEYEPLLPIEKQLISWSVGLGTGLLLILYWVSTTFFPSGH